MAVVSFQVDTEHIPTVSNQLGTDAFCISLTNYDLFPFSEINASCICLKTSKNLSP